MTTGSRPSGGETLYFEVEEHAKLVYDHGGNDDRPPMFRVSVTFAEVDGKTHMDMTMSLPTPEAAEEARKFIKKAGGNSTWDRLAEHLEKGSSGKEQFVINRSFEVPLDVLFEMWTNPQHFSQWLPPTGFEMQFLRAEIKTGGSSLYFMSNGEGVKFHGRTEYLKIQSPDCLVYTQQFCDEQEKVSRHPLAPTWPATMLTTVELTAESPERTRVTVTWEPYGATTPEELAAFIAARAGMTLGWTGSFDKLDEALTSSLLIKQSG